MITFIVKGERDTTLLSSSNHDVVSIVVKEMRCGGPQHGYAHYCRCVAEEDALENIMIWYEETLKYKCNPPVGCITVVEDYVGEFDVFHYLGETYDEYGRRIP